MADTPTDPVCDMRIRPDEAAASAEHEGHTIYFCSRGCRAEFLQDPQRYSRPGKQ